MPKPCSRDLSLTQHEGVMYTHLSGVTIPAVTSGNERMLYWLPPFGGHHHAF